MGYRRSALLLEWPEESEFSGLEIRMRRLSIGQLTEVEKLADLSTDKTRSTGEALADLLDSIGDGLLSWNYEEEQRSEDGSTVTVALPAERASLDRLDLDLVLALVREWISVAAVPLASSPSSNAGEPEPPDELGNWLAWEQQQNQESSPAPA